MSTPPPEIAPDYVETATRLADLARRSTLARFRRRLRVDSKRDASPVTAADRETERAMRDLIEARHPRHGVFGEEFGHREGAEPWQWILDPIDGTRSFACGKPTFGSLIALCHGDRAMLGIIEMPALDERWIGIRDGGARHNGAPCRAARAGTLRDAVVLASTPDMFGRDDWRTFDRVCAKARARAFGADCLGYGLLASGHTDVVMEADLKPYDYMAVVPIVEGAGGVISDWGGRPLDPRSDGRVLACSNARLHETILGMIAGNASSP